MTDQLILEHRMESTENLEYTMESGSIYFFSTSFHELADIQ